MYVKSVLRSQKGSLLYVKSLQCHMTIVSVQNTFKYIWRCEYQYKEATLILIRANNLECEYKYVR